MNNQDATDLNDSIINLLLKKKLEFKTNVKDENGSLFGGPKRVEFFIEGLPGFKRGLFLHTRFQAVTGSADQKYPYLIGCFAKLKAPSVLVLDGPYWDREQRPRVLNWLKIEAGNGNFADLVFYKDLEKWINKKKRGK